MEQFWLIGVCALGWGAGWAVTGKMGVGAAIYVRRASGYALDSNHCRGWLGSRAVLLLLVVYSWLSLCAGSFWAYFGAESLFAKLRVLKTSVGFFAYLIASSFKYSVTCLWASLGGKPSCSSADFNKLLSLSGSIKYGFIYFSYPFFKFIPRRYYR